jgi:hypothetical protein
MKHIHFFIFAAFAVPVFFGSILSGCKEAGTASGTPGDMIGFVQIYDSLRQQVTNNSGVTVSLEGTPYSTVSDVSGKWHLENIPTGTYKIAITKDTYATQKIFNVQITGNGTYYPKLGATEMYPIPHLTSNLVLRPFESEQAIFSTQCEKRNVYVFAAIYFNTTEHIDPADPGSFLYFTFSSDYQDASGNFNITVYRSNLLKAGFTPDQTIYCSAFATTDPVIGASWYDPETNKTVYSGFSPNHSEVKSFVLP